MRSNILRFFSLLGYRCHGNEKLCVSGTDNCGVVLMHVFRSQKHSSSQLHQISSKWKPLLGLLTNSLILFPVILQCCVFLSLLNGCDSCYAFPPDKEDPCKNLECSYGAECVASMDGMSARCQVSSILLVVMGSYGDLDFTDPYNFFSYS